MFYAMEFLSISHSCFNYVDYALLVNFGYVEAIVYDNTTILLVSP